MDSQNQFDITGKLKREDLWFRDGTIVLVAGNYIFRVYQGVLAQSCQFFEDLMDVASSNDSQETFEGVPVVTMQDKPEEAVYFLCAIFLRSPFPPPPEKVSFDEAFGILRLAHKYQSDTLRRRALDHISTTFPTTLLGYENLEGQTLHSCSFQECCVATQIVEETNQRWLLPALLLTLVTYWPSKLIYSPGSPSPSFSPEILACCISFKFEIPRLRNNLLSFLYPVDKKSSCTQQLTCNTSRHCFIQLMNEINDSRADNLFEGWQDISKEYRFSSHVCQWCKKHCAKRYKRGREEIWSHLPSLFGMNETWADLEKMKKVVFQESLEKAKD